MRRSIKDEWIAMFIWSFSLFSGDFTLSPFNFILIHNVNSSSSSHSLYRLTSDFFRSWGTCDTFRVGMKVCSIPHFFVISFCVLSLMNHWLDGDNISLKFFIPKVLYIFSLIFQMANNLRNIYRGLFVYLFALSRIISCCYCFTCWISHKSTHKQNKNQLLLFDLSLWIRLIPD